MPLKSANGECHFGYDKLEVKLMTVKNEIYEHLQRHIVYPTTKGQIVEACNRMSDVQEADRALFEKYLPDWSFNNADEVIRAVEVSEHLGHVTYPTTKKELVKACNNMTDVPRSHREWFERNLPDRSYTGADHILGILRGVQHVRWHVTYPATKALIVEGCNKMSEVPQAEKDLFVNYLPDKTYNNPDDVIKAFRM